MMDGPDDPEAAMRAAGAVVESFTPKLTPSKASDPVAPLALLDPRAWTGTPPARRWIVRDWIPAASVTGLYGDGGIGKTLLAQQLLTAVALGAPWLGMETAPGRALGVFCEDDAPELQRRQHAINGALGAAPADLANLRLLSRVGEDNTLMAFASRDPEGELTRFFAALDATLRDFRPDLLALDTAADMFGGDENIRPQVRRFIAGCLGRLARDHNCAVLLLAHPSLSGLTSGSGTGGSTAWNNSLRSRLYLARPPEESQAVRILSRRKSNYAAAGEEVRLEWREGAFFPAQAASAGAASWPDISRLFEEIASAWEAGRPWSYRPETRKGGRYLPSWAAKHLGLSERHVAQMLGDWLESGCLAMEVADAKSKTRGLRVLRHPSQ